MRKAASVAAVEFTTFIPIVITATDIVTVARSDTTNAARIGIDTAIPIMLPSALGVDAENKQSFACSPHPAGNTALFSKKPPARFANGLKAPDRSGGAYPNTRSQPVLIARGGQSEVGPVYGHTL
jgi:hypothetical protein